MAKQQQPDEDAFYNPFIGDEDTARDVNAFHDALGALAKTQPGKALIWEILKKTRVYDATFNGNSGDIYNKGQRSIGLWLIEQMDAVSPTTYPQLLLDVAKAHEREAERQQQRTENPNG